MFTVLLFPSLQYSDSQEEQGASRCERMGGTLKEEKLESIRECPYYHISKWYLVSFATKQTLQEQLAGTLSFLWRWFIVRSIDISWAPVMCKTSCFELFKIQRESYTRCRSGFHKICKPTSKTKSNKSLLIFRLLSKAQVYTACAQTPLSHLIVIILLQRLDKYRHSHFKEEEVIFAYKWRSYD